MYHVDNDRVLFYAHNPNMNACCKLYVDRFKKSIVLNYLRWNKIVVFCPPLSFHMCHNKVSGKFESQIIFRMPHSLTQVEREILHSHRMHGDFISAIFK